MDETLNLSIDGYLTEDNNQAYDFIDGTVCSFIVKQPEEMGDKDFLWMSIYDVSRATVYVSNGQDYKYSGTLPTEVTSTPKKFGILKGKDFYVVALANSQSYGSFKI